jgi:hypothetical protein
LWVDLLPVKHYGRKSAWMTKFSIPGSWVLHSYRAREALLAWLTTEGCSGSRCAHPNAEDLRSEDGSITAL